MANENSTRNIIYIYFRTRPVGRPVRVYVYATVNNYRRPAISGEVAGAAIVSRPFVRGRRRRCRWRWRRRACVRVGPSPRRGAPDVTSAPGIGRRRDRGAALRPASGGPDVRRVSSSRVQYVRASRNNGRSRVSRSRYYFILYTRDGVFVLPYPSSSRYCRFFFSTYIVFIYIFFF